jgi:hypothetical protein
LLNTACDTFPNCGAKHQLTNENKNCAAIHQQTEEKKDCAAIHQQTEDKKGCAAIHQQTEEKTRAVLRSASKETKKKKMTVLQEFGRSAAIYLVEGEVMGGVVEREWREECGRRLSYLLH